MPFHSAEVMPNHGRVKWRELVRLALSACLYSVRHGVDGGAPCDVSCVGVVRVDPLCMAPDHVPFDLAERVSTKNMFEERKLQAGIAGVIVLSRVRWGRNHGAEASAASDNAGKAPRV